MKHWVFLAGLAHIALAAGSLLIPHLLNWRNELSKVLPLIRQMFWTYAGYILFINLFFGLISVFFPDDLLAGEPLGQSLLLFIALYWAVRLVIQFTYFDKTGLPNGPLYTLGEWMLVMLFVAFVAIYSVAFVQSSLQ